MRILLVGRLLMKKRGGKIRLTTMDFQSKVHVHVHGKTVARWIYLLQRSRTNNACNTTCGLAQRRQLPRITCSEDLNVSTPHNV